jgi:hypothetical protein
MKCPREARRTRRERRAHLSSCDPIDLWHSDLSAFRARINLLQDTASVEPQLPPVANGLIGNDEGADDIALLRFAREKGKPVLVEFSWKPSKVDEGSLRQSAKNLNLKLPFFRLMDRWAIVEVHPKETLQKHDANILKGLGVRW